MKAVHYNNQLVAFARGSQIRLNPDLAALAPDHPDRRWAVALAVYACKTDTGQHPSRYTDADACAYARQLLIPTADFALLADRDDHALAAAFAVPPEQIAARRAELGLVWS